MGYNSAFAEDICEIFASVGRFQGWAIKHCQENSTRPTAVVTATKFETNSHNSDSARDISKILASGGQSNSSKTDPFAI